MNSEENDRMGQVFSQAVALKDKWLDTGDGLAFKQCSALLNDILGSKSPQYITAALNMMGLMHLQEAKNTGSSKYLDTAEQCYRLLGPVGIQPVGC